MCSLNHWYIIGTITNSESHLSLSILDQLHNIGLLTRRNTTANYGAALTGQRKELTPQLPIVENGGECGTLNDESQTFLALLSVRGHAHVLFQSGIQITLISPAQVNNPHVVIEQVTCKPNVDGRILFVSGEYPQLNIGLGELRNCVWNTMLQLILNSSNSHKIEVSLNLVTQFFEALLSSKNEIGCLLESLIPRFVLCLVELSLGTHQCSETCIGKYVEEIVGDVCITFR
mmetsp:Transcript_5843/g.22164  ORF Transcript_5843/g.22164 Transcript_5843/m.22164 type:complete len:231 (-) Transcript_5843:2516-3208(-)